MTEAMHSQQPQAEISSLSAKYWMPPVDLWSIPSQHNLAHGWVDFVDQRIFEAVEMTRHAATVKSPFELWGLYGQFCQHAMDDYCHCLMTSLKAVAVPDVGVRSDTAQKATSIN